MDFHKSAPALHNDPVTGLPNRQKFVEDFPRGVADDLSVVMVTLADAKHFNEILRALGHEWSDEFICEGATRVKRSLAAGVALYHVSVLSFAFVHNGGPDKLIEEIVASFRLPVCCQDIPVLPRVGVGVAFCQGPDGAMLKAAEGLRAALVAAQDSRSATRGWAVYDRSKDSAHRRGFTILSQLSAALASGDQLQLAFQPKVDVATGRLAGAEALLRWTHPTMGVISPAEFIPLAETTDHVHTLTSWVVDHALTQSAAWVKDGLDLTMAINVSPHNLSQKGFAAGFIKKMKEHGVHPSSVELEFTEGVLMTNDEVVVGELRALREHGVNIALDDFGTGFSNLGYISKLPANIIKIDRSLILPIATDARAAVVVQSLIGLAHKLDYRVVAEGIETSAIYAVLKGWHCNEAQGYYLSRPLTAEGFANYVVTRGSNAKVPVPVPVPTHEEHPVII